MKKKKCITKKKTQSQIYVVSDWEKKFLVYKLPVCSSKLEKENIGMKIGLKENYLDILIE